MFARARHIPLVTRIFPVGQNSGDRVKPPQVKYFALPKFGFVVQAKHPGPRQGADRDRTELRARQRWTRRRRARRTLQGGLAVSNDLHADDTTLTASSYGFGREHAPAPGIPAKTCADEQVVWS